MNNMKFSDTLLWEYKYRPQTLDDMVLPKRIYNKILPMIKSADNLKNCILYSAQPGTGKTSTAELIPKMLGIDYIKLKAGEGAGEGGVSAMRDIKSYARKRSLDGRLKVVILDECDFLSPNAESALRNIIDECSGNTRFILTCNYLNKVSEPILSRMTYKIDYNIKTEEADALKLEFIKRCNYICKKENVTIEDPVPNLLYEIVKQHFPDYRQIVEDLDTISSENDGKITVASIDDLLRGLDSDHILSALKSRNVPKIKELALRYSTDVNRLINNLYYGVMDHVDAKTRVLFIKYMAYLNVNSNNCVSKEVLIAETLINMSCLQFTGQ